MILVTTFIAVFALGPAVFWLLSRRRLSRNYIRGLCGATILPVAVAILAGRSSGMAEPLVALAVVSALWLGWIIVVSFCALAVRAHLPRGRENRMALAFGAMATTLPWFGLHAAQMVGG